MDFEKDAEEIAPTATVEDISGALLLRQKLVDTLIEANLQVKRGNEKLRLMDEEIIPELFKNAKVDRVDWEGHTVTVKPDIRVSIKKDDKEAAHNWFEHNGHGGIIKSKVTMSFSDLVEAREFMTFLHREMYVPELSRDIHWSTLRATVNEIHDDGKQVDEDIINIYRFNKTTVKVTKK